MTKTNNSAENVSCPANTTHVSSCPPQLSTDVSLTNSGFLQDRFGVEQMKVLFLSLLVTLGCKCGTASEHSEGHQLRAVDEDRQWEPRIVGGQDASKGEFPFFVQGRGCGASLIWKDIVLCASHCKGAVGNFRGRVLVGATEKDDEV